MWAVCDLFASVPSYYDNTRCGGARRIRVLSESAHVIMCVPHARVRTCDFVHIRMRECACMIMCVPHMRNVLYETALRALRERPAGRFASRGCAHQDRMRTYGIDRIRYKGNSNHYVGNLAEDARLRMDIANLISLRATKKSHHQRHAENQTQIVSRQNTRSEKHRDCHEKQQRHGRANRSITRD